MCYDVISALRIVYRKYSAVDSAAKFLSRGNLMAHYLYACLSQIFTVHILHFLLGFGYTVNTDCIPAAEDNAITLNTRNFLKQHLSPVLFIMSLLLNPFSCTDSCFVGKFFLSAFCRGGCISPDPLHEISHSHIISYSPVPGTHECLHAKSACLFLTTITSKVAPRTTITSSLNFPPYLL